MQAIARIVVLGAGAAALVPLGLLLQTKDTAGVARKLSEWAPGQKLDTPLVIAMTGALLLGLGRMHFSALHQGARDALLVTAFVQLGVGAAAGALVSAGLGANVLALFAVTDAALGLLGLLHHSLNVVSGALGFLAVMSLGVPLLADPNFIPKTFNAVVFANLLKAAPEVIQETGLEKMPSLTGKGPFAFHLLVVTAAAQGIACVMTAGVLGPRALRTVGKMFVAQAALLGGLAAAGKASLEIAGGLAGGLGAAGLLVLALVPKPVAAETPKRKTA